MTVLNKITNFFKEDYFIFGRRIVGLNEKILEAPIKEGKIKYINLLEESYKVDVLTNKVVKSTVIYESRFLCALRITSLVTLIFPLIGIVFCLLGKTRVLPPETQKNLERNWKNRLVPGNKKAFPDLIIDLIDSVIRSDIDPLSLKKESLLTMQSFGKHANDLTVFYAEDYHLSAEVAHQAPMNTLKVPLKERIHLKCYPYNHAGFDRFEQFQPSLKGSSVVLAPKPYRGQKLPKALELYFKYLEKKQRVNSTT